MSHNNPYNHRELHDNAGEEESLSGNRRPMQETMNRLLRGLPQAPSVAQPPSNMRNFKLSADAPVFVPKTFQFQGNQAVPSYPPPSLSLSAGAAEFVPRTDFVPAPGGVLRNIGPPVPQMPPDDDAILASFTQMNLVGNNASVDPVAGYLLQEFSDTMMILNTMPANIRDYLSPLCDKLRQAQTLEILHQVIEILYEQSVFVPNFRYTGARVCHFMCSELKDHHIFGQFKSEFLKKCQHDFIQREELIKAGGDSLGRLCGLTLFMGELFLNVTADASGKTERLDFLPSALTDLVMTLLSQPSDLSVKTACQLLKLAGGPTEDAMSSKEPHFQQNFMSIFTTLQSILSMPVISENMKHLIKSVLRLQQSNWDRPDSRSQAGGNHQASVVQEPDFLQPEPVFYDQYGKPITREEAGYQDEDEEENYEDYVLTEEEEREFLKWQEETENKGVVAPSNHYSGPDGQQHYANPRQAYQPWSTNDSGYDYNNYTSNYGYNTLYPTYPEDDALTMDDEAEQAYEEFLSSQHQRPPTGH